MYGYRTKHKILTEYLKRVQKDSPKDGNLDPTHTVLYKQFAREIGKKEPKSGYIAQQMFVLLMEGYLHYGKKHTEPDDIEISITPKGMNAAMGEVFKIKQNEWFWRAFMNILMTIANVAVAITAIWALTKDNGEVQRLEERLNKLEKVLYTPQVKANPNTLHLQNNSQPTTIDTEKKTFKPTH